MNSHSGQTSVITRVCLVSLISWKTSWNRCKSSDTYKKLGCAGFVTFGKYFCLVLMLVFPSATLGVGAVHIHDCPCFPSLPIYLVLLGSCGVISGIISLFHDRVFCERCVILSTGFNTIQGLIAAFYLWDSIEVFKMYEPNYDRTGEEYCDKTVYLFAFSLSVIMMTLCVIFFLFWLIMLIVMCNKKSDHRMNNSEEPILGRNDIF